MRSLPALALLAGLVALAGAGCGSAVRSPAAVVRAWSAALDRGDNEAAAGLFATGAEIVQGDLVLRLGSRAAAVRWNASLPCTGTIVSLRADGPLVHAAFLLGDRPTSRCDGPGATASAVILVRHGRIVLWHQTPTRAAPPGPTV